MVTSGHDAILCLQLITDAIGQRHSESGDGRPASTNRHATLRSPPDYPLTSRHQL